MDLTGVRVLVTRAREQALELTRRIEALGGEAVVHPCIRIEPARKPERVREAAEALATYDWVVFTSVNGVERFVAELVKSGAGIAGFEHVRVAAVGSRTAAALGQHGVDAEVVPEQYVAESLLEAVRARVGGRPRVLLPVAEGARTVLERGLREAGAVVERVHVYRTAPVAEEADRLRHVIESGGVDIVTLTSPSTVEGFVNAVGTDLGAARVVVIGPITAEAARRSGLAVAAQAEPFTTDGLVAAIVDLVQTERGRTGGV